MSRIGRLPVVIEKSVKVTLGDHAISVEGPKGKLAMPVPEGFKVEIQDGKILVKRPGDSPDEKAKHGLIRKLIANMVQGVSKGFTRVLEINGVGYRAEVRGPLINFALGYSHPVAYQLPPGISAKIERQVIITLESADRQLLGTVAAQIRALRPPEPYKGKGIKYAQEVIRRKAGKAAAGASAT